MSFSGAHDAYRIIQGLTQSLNVISGTASAVTTAFGTQTRAVNILINSAVSSNANVFVKFFVPGAETSVVTSLIDCPVPANWVQTFKVNPGMKVAFISNDPASCRAYVTELTD